VAKSPDGWLLDGPTRAYPVPGTAVTLTLTADANAATCLVWAAWAFNDLVAKLDPAQCIGYDKRDASNARSGTAADLNYNTFPTGELKMSAAQIAACQRIVAGSSSVLRWGGDNSTSLVDQARFELDTTDATQIKDLVASITAAPGKGKGAAKFKSPPAIPKPDPVAPGDKPLEKIGPAKIHAVIPLTHASYVDPLNRLIAVKVRGHGLTAQVASAVTAASMSFSATQVGELTLTVADTPDAEFIRSGIFTKGTTIDFGDQHLDLRGIDYAGDSGSPLLTLKSRSRVISVLRDPEQTGRGAWAEQDVSRWVRDRCHEAGAIPVVQANLGALTFIREAGDPPETTWDVMVKAAATKGCLCWECEQVIYFMKPSALMKLRGRREWPISWTDWDSYTDGLAGMPRYTWSLDGDAEALSFELLSADADKARPGDRVIYAGSVKQAAGTWMITQADLPFTGTAPVAVTCARPVDPPPEAAA